MLFYHIIICAFVINDVLLSLFGVLLSLDGVFLSLFNVILSLWGLLFCHYSIDYFFLYEKVQKKPQNPTQKQKHTIFY